jgi:hypothetical protein
MVQILIVPEALPVENSPTSQSMPKSKTSTMFG